MIKPMKNSEYREKLGALGLTQIGAAEFLGVGERTSRRYALLALIPIKVHAYAAWTCEPGGAAVVNTLNW
jgi:hypothetical protein